VNAIGTIINGLDPESLAEPTSADATADALAQIDAALALAGALDETLDSEWQQATALHPLSALAPQSDADGLLLAKAIADGLRNTADALGSGKRLSTKV
jgi:hypothetical protein